MMSPQLVEVPLVKCAVWDRLVLCPAARRSRTWSAVLLPAVIMLLAACESDSPARAGRPAGGRAPSILIVVLDACRADRLGCYGYDRPTSPAIDALAGDPDAVVYLDHHVQGAFTKSSTASLFTGLYVFQHGVIRGHDIKQNPAGSGVLPVQVLPEQFHTMAEQFGEIGMWTFGVVKSYHLDPESGFAQGFDEYYPAKSLHGDWLRVRKTVDLIAAAPGPFFGYLHLEACHHPFPERYRHAEIMEAYGFDYDEEARKARGVDFTTAQIKHAINDEELALTSEGVRFLNLIYDAKLRFVDEHLVAPLIDSLKKVGRYDDTLVILTADHGEELYDHRGYAHGHALWEEVIRVPLIVKFPKGRRPRRLAGDVEATTQSVDLLPSLLAFLGRPAGEDLPGADIFDGAGRDFAYSQTETQWTLIQDAYKLIDGGGTTLLFSRASDPGEQVNLAEREPDRVEAMRQAATAMRQHVTTAPREAPVHETELDEEAIKALRSLGYLR